MAEGWTYQLTFQGEIIELSESEQIAGRSRACDIPVPDASVSRKHARLKPGPGHILIQDLNSSNGTFINDRRVQGEGAAENGDVLRLGDAELRIAIDNPAAYQTMRLPTGGVAPVEPSGHKPAGPATTMLAHESVKLAQQAELDRLARESAAAGQRAESIPVVPEASAAPALPPLPPPPPAAAPAAEQVSQPSPLATQRLEIPPTPHQTQRFDSSTFAPAPTPPPPSSMPAEAPLDPAATRRLEIPRSAPPAPDVSAAPAGHGGIQGFDLDDSIGANEVRPPDDFVPGTGPAWQTEPPEEIPAPPPAPEFVVVPEPLFTPEPTVTPEPASGPKFDRPVASWAEKPPGDGDATFAEINYDSRTTVEPPDDGSWEPPDIEREGASFESSWVPGGTRDADADGGFAPPPPKPSPALSPVSPRDPVQAPVQTPVPTPTQSPPTPSPSTLSFDRPTPPASPPASPSLGAFDQPTPAAAPPPAQMPREVRVSGGASGLLPTLDELDGAIAGPEMEMPYQPDPDPTAAVPVVTHRRLDVGEGFLLRALATILDMLWISALTVAAWMVSDENQMMSFAVNSVCVLGIIVGWALWGTSPGKKALGLTVEGKVPGAKGGIGFLRAIIRAAGYLVSSLTLGIGFLMIAFSSDKRGLHDRIAGTWVRRRG